MSIEQIRTLISTGNYELTIHAFRRIVERNISADEIRVAGKEAEVIEDYPSDKYGPTCLLLGWTTGRRPLHIQVSRKENVKVKIVTLYEPMLDEWEDYRRRRTS